MRLRARPRRCPGLPFMGRLPRRVPLLFMRWTWLRYRWHRPIMEDPRARVRCRFRWGWVRRRGLG